MIRILYVFFAAMLLSGCAGTQKAAITPTDNNLWLEEIEGQKALDWVQQQNQKSLGEIESDARYKKVEGDILKILNAKDRIPHVALRGGELYNFWQDEKNVRGLWRKTTMAEYKKKNPKWDIVLDLDALAKKENENWVWKGSNCLPPKMTRCLLSLSKGGKDAVVIREFDVTTRKFVENGFNLLEAKTSLAWNNIDSLFLGTDFGPGSLTDSGYPAQVRFWKRGTPIASAQMLFKCEKTDVSCRAFKSFTPEGEATVIQRSMTFYTSQYFKVSSDLKITKMNVPEDVEYQSNFKGHDIFLLRTAWKGAQGGDLVSVNSAGEVQVVAKVSDRGSIQGAGRSSDALYVTRLENVTSQIDKVTWNGQAWISQKVDLPELGSADVVAMSELEPRVFFQYEGYLVPPTLYVSDGNSKPEKIKSIPERFNAKGLTVEQLETTSRDGTRVPYFLIRNKSVQGPVATVLYGYGGFEVSETPFYMSAVGKAWLEKGGAYAVANIRGGGEFGPKWHQAALKEKRQTAFDDFVAVAEDLIKRGITTSQKLGIRGGSNGGLLTGAVFVQRPDLFNAVVCQVPLLDMLRYNTLLAGASWMAEYGDPTDSKIRDFWMKTSPYQNVKAGVKYPRVFISTSTKDDRVHPGHARKMVARMIEQGHPVLYYENIEGGHSAAANLAQRARREAQSYVYLYRQLMQ